MTNEELKAIEGRAASFMGRYVVRDGLCGAIPAGEELATDVTALCGVVRERDATMTGEAIAKAIRAFTIDMPNDEPNGPRERQLEVLGQALERGDLRTARRAYGFMCEAGGDDLMALRVAAEAHFGGDFRAASTSCATEEEQG